MEHSNAKEAIKAYLDKRAATDELFAASYKKPGKSLDECFRYILSEAKKQGTAVCMTDEEVYGLAVHYYDEDHIAVPANIGAVRASHSAPRPKVQLTEEEKAEARLAAKKEYLEACIAEEREKAKPRRKPAMSPEIEAGYPSLFDL